MYLCYLLTYKHADRQTEFAIYIVDINFAKPSPSWFYILLAEGPGVAR